MHWSKTGVSQFHAQLGLPDKGMIFSKIFNLKLNIKCKVYITIEKPRYYKLD